MKDDKIKVLIRRAGQEPTVEIIPNTLKAKQEIVGGWIEMPHNPEFSEGLQIVCDEEGKFKTDPKPNVYWGDYDVIFGNIFFVAINDEGEDISLTPKQIDEAKKWIIENDASGIIDSGVDDSSLAETFLESHREIEMEAATIFSAIFGKENLPKKENDRNKNNGAEM